jgi:protein ImuB
VGIAGSRIGALVASRRGDGVTVVAPGEDAAYLEPAPLSLLDLSNEMATRLDRWGIRTLGELAALPAAALFERLGGEGVRLRALARGDDPRPLRPWTPPPTFEESVDLRWAMKTLDPLVALLTRLAERLCEQLVRRGLSADRLEWLCHLTDRTAHEGECSPACPTNEPAVIAALLKASIESRPPRGAVDAVRLVVNPVRVPSGQGMLTERSRSNPRTVTATLARLAALVGAQQLGVPALLDTHRPDAVMLVPCRFGKEAEGEGAGRSDRLMTRAVLALRRLRPPLPAGVTCEAGRPAHLRTDRLAGNIVISIGPWRSSGEWWTGHPWCHDEWDVELADGVVGRLTHDGSAWWLEGIYD